MVFQDVLNRYQDYLQDKGKTKKTSHCYRTDVDWLIKIFSIQDLNAFSSLSARSIQKQLGCFELSTQRRKMAGLESFFKFLSEKESISCNFDLQRPKNVTKQLTYLSQEAYSMLRQIKISRDDQVNIKNLALLDVLYGSGIKVSTASALNWEQINLKKNYLKNLEGYVRTVPLSQESQKSFKAYKQTVQNRASACFLNDEDKRIATGGIHRKIRDYGERIGIPLSPTVLRRSYLFRLMAEEKSCEEVFNLMGYDPSGKYCYSTAYSYLKRIFPQMKALEPQPLHPSPQPQLLH